MIISFKWLVQFLKIYQCWIENGKAQVSQNTLLYLGIFCWRSTKNDTLLHKLYSDIMLRSKVKEWELFTTSLYIYEIHHIHIDYNNERKIFTYLLFTCDIYISMSFHFKIYNILIKYIYIWINCIKIETILLYLQFLLNIFIEIF